MLPLHPHRFSVFAVLDILLHHSVQGWEGSYRLPHRYRLPIALPHHMLMLRPHILVYRILERTALSDCNNHLFFEGGFARRARTFVG